MLHKRRQGPGDGRRETGDGRRETGDGRRETGDGRRETGDGRRRTGDGGRRTGDGRRETGDGRRETGDGRRETGDGRRETGDGRRETGGGRGASVDGRRGTHKDSSYSSTQTRVFGGPSLASAASSLRAVVSLGRNTGQDAGETGWAIGMGTREEGMYVSSPRVDRRHGWRRLHPVANAVVLVSWWLLLECSHRTTGLQAVLNPKHRPGVVAARAAR